MAPPQEAPCDVTSFRLYTGSTLQRCSQRVTGLLTIHLLGLEDMRTSRWDTHFLSADLCTKLRLLAMLLTDTDTGSAQQPGGWY